MCVQVWPGILSLNSRKKLSQKEKGKVSAKGRSPRRRVRALQGSELRNVVWASEHRSLVVAEVGCKPVELYVRVSAPVMFIKRKEDRESMSCGCVVRCGDGDVSAAHAKAWERE